jgi:hypothetical protein
MADVSRETSENGGHSAIDRAWDRGFTAALDH